MGKDPPALVGVWLGSYPQRGSVSNPERIVYTMRLLSRLTATAAVVGALTIAPHASADLSQGFSNARWHRQL